MSNPYYHYGVNDLEDDAHHSSVMALLSQQSNVMFHKGIKKSHNYCAFTATPYPELVNAKVSTPYLGSTLPLTQPIRPSTATTE